MKYRYLAVITLFFFLGIHPAATAAVGDACVGNLVWLDTDGDGIRESGEPAFTNIEIRLKKKNLVVDSVVTPNGYFSLCSGAAGEHTLEIDVPSGYVISPANAGNSEHTDSDSDENGSITVITRANQNQTKYDFGLTTLTPISQKTTKEVNETYSDTEAEEAADSVSFTGCVGNLAWIDTNADGIKNTNETGVAISKIELVSKAGNVVDFTSTESGYYQLCSVPGTYEIVFDLPDGYKATIKDARNSDTADSDANDAGAIVAEVVANKNKTKYDIGLVPLSAPVEQAAAPAQQPEQQAVEQSINTSPGSGVAVRWGFWTETRNSYQSPLKKVDKGVESTFERYTFSHVKALSLQTLRGNTQSKEYVVNVLNAAEKTDTSLDIQLGGSGEYGWNFSTGRGNFQLSRWKTAISRFSKSADPVAHAAIVKAIKNGTIRYVFLIDEPNHSRWSPTWNGKHGAGATGSANHVSNQNLDKMAAHVKAIFGNNTKTIVRTSPVNLIAASRGGMYSFQHMTHAYLTISSAKWVAGSNKGPNKGFEWFLNLKNNYTDNTTNLSAYKATNLQPSIMIQAGLQSNGNPWTGEKDFANRWWQGNVRYPFNGATGYVKAAPGEMDYWIKSLLSPRDPNTGVLSKSGVRWFNEFVIFRADRLPTDRGRLPFSTYAHYSAFLDQLDKDLKNKNLKPIIGVPVGWTGD